MISKKNSKIGMSFEIFFHIIPPFDFIYCIINKNRLKFCWENGKNYEIKTWYNT